MALSRRTTKVPGKGAATPQGNPVRPATPVTGKGTGTRGPGTPAPRKPAAAEEPILEALPEPVPQPEVQQTPSGKQLAARVPSPAVGTRKSTSSLKAYQGDDGGDAQNAPEDKKRRGSREGTEIGNLQRRGWSLALKISVFTLFTIGVVTSLFGYVSVKAMRETLVNEIKRSGYNSIENFKGFGLKIPLDFTNGDAFHASLDKYKSLNADDQKYLKGICASDQRIQDICVFAAYPPTSDPSYEVIRATGSRGFEPAPAEGEGVEGIMNFDATVKIYKAKYGDKQCLWFRIPLHAAGDNSFYATAVLIMSQTQIDEQLAGMVNKLVIFGVMFAAGGVILSLWLASLISRPVNVLVSDVNTVAKGELEYESTVPGMTNDEIGLLAMAFNRMTKSLREAREKEREAQRLAGDVNAAKAIHAQLIPSKRPELPGIDIYTEYNCAKEVGGDYYDFIPVGDSEHLALCVADVSGKGIPGSMVMGTTRTYLRMMAVNCFRPAEVLSKTNFYVAREIKRGMFVTCVYAILNLRTREMTVASAGHNPMLIWRAATKTIEKVRPNGIALGFDKGPIFDRTAREEKVKLNVGDRVVMYTDGVVESMNEQREEWSDEALDAFTLQHAHLPSKDYVRLLKKALEDHQGRAEQHDDITIVTFRVTPVAGGTASVPREG